MKLSQTRDCAYSEADCFPGTYIAVNWEREVCNVSILLCGAYKGQVFNDKPVSASVPYFTEYYWISSVGTEITKCSSRCSPKRNRVSDTQEIWQLPKSTLIFIFIQEPSLKHILSEKFSAVWLLMNKNIYIKYLYALTIFYTKQNKCLQCTNRQQQVNTTSMMVSNKSVSVFRKVRFCIFTRLQKIQWQLTNFYHVDTYSLIFLHRFIVSNASVGGWEI